VVGSSVVVYHIAPDPTSLHGGGGGSTADMYPMALHRMWAMRVKDNLAMLLGSHVTEAGARDTKAPNVRAAIMGL
jgi:hypothetical protein